MSELLRIESELGRVREIKWGPRVIDLDLRDFVLKPLNEIAQYALHPLKNKRIFELVDC